MPSGDVLDLWCFVTEKLMLQCVQTSWFSTSTIRLSTQQTLPSLKDRRTETLFVHWAHLVTRHINDEGLLKARHYSTKYHWLKTVKLVIFLSSSIALMKGLAHAGAFSS